MDGVLWDNFGTFAELAETVRTTGDNIEVSQERLRAVVLDFWSV